MRADPEPEEEGGRWGHRSGNRGLKIALAVVLVSTLMV